MVIEVPYRYQDDWGRDRVTVLRYQRDIDPNTHHVRWALVPGQWEKVDPAAGNETLRVVALGGGTGLPVVLRALRPFAAPGPASANARTPDLSNSRTFPGLVARPSVSAGNSRTSEPPNVRTSCGPLDLTAVVTMADDGGSSGELRRHLGVLPPGDVRNCLLALSPESSPLSTLLGHRFESTDGLAGHSLGNLFLAASSQQRGNFMEAVALAASLLGAAGRVLPCTQDPVELVAEFEDGVVVAGESRIPERRGRIRRVRLAPADVRPTPQVLEALAAADLIVVGPGSLYTSLLPILLVPGVTEAMRASAGVRVLVANLMTQPGETDGYNVADHLAAIETHVGEDLFDVVLVNSARLGDGMCQRYAAEGAHPVVFDPSRVEGEELLCVAEPLVAEGDLARHDPDRLARALLDLATSHQCHGQDRSGVRTFGSSGVLHEGNRTG